MKMPVVFLLATCCSCSLAALERAAPPGDTPEEIADEVVRRIEAGRPDLALNALEEHVEATRPESLREGWPFPLEKLRARCLFALGDYPRCERSLRMMIASRSITPDVTMECQAQLAKVLSIQGLHDQAIRTIDRALEHPMGFGLRRVAVSLWLRARQHARALPHVTALIQADERDGFAHFARGIILSRQGRHEEAVAELRWGLNRPGAQRDARFELALALGKLGRPREALVHLWEILEDDPYDEEACYQASRQHLRRGGARSVRVGAILTRYFETLKKTRGSSSREYHLRAAGQADQAALLRARRFERLGEHERVLDQLARASVNGRGSLLVLLYRIDYWVRMELHAEAERLLETVDGDAVGTEDAGRISRLRDGVARGLESIRREAGKPLGDARWLVATTPWERAAPALGQLLESAVAASSGKLADRTARLLLARDRRSLPALRHMVKRTREPSFLVIHAHYLARAAAAAEPGEDRWREELKKVKAVFLGQR